MIAATSPMVAMAMVVVTVILLGLLTVLNYQPPMPTVPGVTLAGTYAALMVTVCLVLFAPYPPAPWILGVVTLAVLWVAHVLYMVIRQHPQPVHTTSREPLFVVQRLNKRGEAVDAGLPVADRREALRLCAWLRRQFPKRQFIVAVKEG